MKTTDTKELDRQELVRLCKVISPSGSDVESIYNLYKKYVDSGARPPKVGGCNTCGNSIVSYWRNLITWFNNSNF